MKELKEVDMDCYMVYTGSMEIFGFMDKPVFVYSPNKIEDTVNSRPHILGESKLVKEGIHFDPIVNLIIEEEEY